MQEVNLLNDELRPHQGSFTIREFSLVLSAVLLFLCVLTAWQAYSVGLTEQRDQTKKGELARLDGDIVRLESLAERRPDSSLTNQLELILARLEEQRQLAAVLQKEPINHGFHLYLSDLASTHMRALWFDSISLAHGGQSIRLKGFSESAEQIPLYLSMLSEGYAFSGYSFDGLKIKRETDALVSFEVLGPQTREAE